MECEIVSLGPISLVRKFLTPFQKIWDGGRRTAATGMRRDDEYQFGNGVIFHPFQ